MGSDLICFLVFWMEFGKKKCFEMKFVQKTEKKKILKLAITKIL
jgi:hypothetical protein